MRAIVQRVSWAEVDVDNTVLGRIAEGLLVYVGVAQTDTPADADRLAEKIAHLRIFPDAEGKLNRNVQDARGGVLAISNFTLLADARKGRRPALSAAAPQDAAEPLYEALLAALRRQGCTVAAGAFGAEMRIRSQAHGPVNIIVDMPPAPDGGGGGGG